MGALTDLWKSERGVVAIAMLILITVAFYLTRVTADQWVELIKWTFVTYTGGKTVTSAVETYTASKTEQAQTAPKHDATVASVAIDAMMTTKPAGEA